MNWVNVLVVGGILLVGLVGASVEFYRWWRSRKNSKSGSGKIHLAFDLRAPEKSDPDYRASPRLAAGPPIKWPPEGLPEPDPVGSPVVLPFPGATPTSRSVPPPTPFQHDAEQALLYEGKTIRFHQPVPGTMRFLPGRLEVVEGEDLKSEIRFVELPGEVPEVTFGRSVGAPLRHVQLHSPTISRKHARMARQGSDWVICNLSRTNPIVINGTTFLQPEEERVLHDADRIEMGEVVFRYYSA